MVLQWTACYADGRSISGCLPEDLPGACPREGMQRLVLSQGSQDDGWTPILAVDLAEHERLVFRRRMTTPLLAPGVVTPIGLIIGTYDTRTDTSSLLYLHGDGTMSLRCATADVTAEPHEVG